MNRINRKERISKETCLMEFCDPDMAAASKPGQFLIVIADEKGERVPLTIADVNGDDITIVFKIEGLSTKKLSRLDAGDYIHDVMGPLGMPSQIKRFGTVAIVGGGVGTAACWPIAKAIKEDGNKVISIIGARSKEALFWTERFENISDELMICTDDGSLGRKGFVTDALADLIKREKIDRVVAIGPTVMMRYVVKTAGDIPCVVSLNPLMVDGMGMCGGCRVNVSGEIKFACVDGPEFIGQDVDWDSFIDRQKTYQEEEHRCRIGL